VTVLDEDLGVLQRLRLTLFDDVREVLLTAKYQFAIVSSVARFIDWIVVSATNPMRHSTMLSGSVHCSANSVNSHFDYADVLTIVAQEIHKPKIGVSNAHEEHLCCVVWSELRLVVVQVHIGHILNIVVPEVRCKLTSLDSSCCRII
jgi:hypothetical protein